MRERLAEVAAVVRQEIILWAHPFLPHAPQHLPHLHVAQSPNQAILTAVQVKDNWWLKQRAAKALIAAALACWLLRDVVPRLIVSRKRYCGFCISDKSEWLR